jgi:membrane fusion protein (multidrug efflux system)
VGIVAAALVLGGLMFWLYERVRETTDDAQITGDIVPVAPRISGTVQQVAVDDNQQVKKGDVLVLLDPRDYQVAIQRAEADLADAEAKAAAAKTGIPISSTTTSSNVAVAKANLAAAEKQVQSAKARLTEAQSKHSLAASDLARFKILLAKDEISQQQYDTAASNEQTLQAGVDAAEAAVATAESQVAQAEAQLRGAETAPQQVVVTRSQAGAAAAEVQMKQAALEQAQLNLEYCTIRAAVDGVVTRKTVEPGQTVQPGQALMALVPLENIWVVANFKENQLHSMRVGQPASIHVDSFNRDYKGHVQSIGAASAAMTSLLPPENATGNFVKVVQRIPVKITFDKGQDPNHLLRPGMSVEPTVLTK